GLGALGSSKLAPSIFAGVHGDACVLAGISVFERQTYWLEQALDAIAEPFEQRAGTEERRVQVAWRTRYVKYLPSP
ncbi:MAG TPA: hypothetical protein VGG24_10515, partial [Paraburkholderia sp.]